MYVCMYVQEKISQKLNSVSKAYLENAHNAMQTIVHVINAEVRLSHYFVKLLTRNTAFHVCIYVYLFCCSKILIMYVCMYVCMYVW